MLIEFWRDLCYSIRALSRNPIFTLSILLSLALGIGLNTAVFSLINALFLRPLPGVAEPDRVAVVFSQTKDGPAYLPISHLNYKDFRAQSRSFTDLAAAQNIAVGLADEDGAEMLPGEMVSASYFDVLAVGMALGRTFSPEEDRAPGTHPVAVLSHRLWRERFAADPHILGRKIILNGQPFTVIGVAAAGFRGTNAFSTPALWVPNMMYRTVFPLPELFEQRSTQALNVYGRLRPGVTMTAAQAEMRALAARLEKAYPDDNRGQSVALVPLSQATIGPGIRPVFVNAAFLLLVIVALLLFITCVNTANLLLVRAMDRAREMALRLSLGARKRHLAGQVLLESLLLALAGGALGLLAAGWVWRLLWRYRPPFFAADALSFALDARVLGFALAACLGTGLLFGLAPVLWVARTDLNGQLRQARPLATLRGHGISVGDLSIVLQVILCTVALAGAGLFLKSLWNARRIDPAFSTGNLLMVSFDLQSLGYDEVRGRDFQELLAARTAALPGVERAALGENRLLGGFRVWRTVLPVGSELAPQDALMAGSSRIGPGYFETVGIPLIAGRGFDGHDLQGAPAVAIINESLRRKLWPDRDPVGLQLRLDDDAEPVQIVGVAKDSKYIQLGENAQPFIYLPLAQRPSLRVTLHLRTQGDPAALAPAVRREAARLNRALPLTEVRALSEILDQSLWLPRTSAVLLSLLGLLALALAGVGIYGVTAYAVARRRYEIGVRIALGARRTDVAGMVFRKAIVVFGVGLVLGLAGAIALNRAIAGLLYGSEVGDPVTFAGVLAVLLGMGALATLPPALRAARIEPVTALRS
ncbi:MAG TPA: ABC transporter permease [Thermoanaerobaculia bacterium]|nr:ABC transporter permease [Thermoanaerobaculia bacterium]